MGKMPEAQNFLIPPRKYSSLRSRSLAFSNVCQYFVAYGLVLEQADIPHDYRLINTDLIIDYLIPSNFCYITLHI